MIPDFNGLTWLGILLSSIITLSYTIYKMIKWVFKETK
jgi:hypothetical protein